MNFPNFCVGFILLVLSIKPCVLTCQNLSCDSNDMRALNGFSKCLASGIVGWDSSTSSDCCTWDGVTCQNSSVYGKRVVKLELGSKRLAGKFCESLAGLEKLRILNLSQNFLNSTVPAKLFHLENLEVLDLSFNEFFGSIPVDTDLPSIQFVDLSGNNFVGSIKSSLCKTSTRIKVLNLSNNYFSGEVPTNLGNCTSLQHLSLDWNNLSGSFPETLFQLRNLSELHLHDNYFFGQLNDGIGNLSNLVKLDISLNQFSGNLPDVFWSLRKLEHFSAASNDFMGRLPASLMNSPSLITLNLNNNSLNGPINLNCSAVSHLASLNLGSNLFHGPVPDSLSSCQRLSTVNLARNNLSSEVPDSFKNLQALRYLSLSTTNLGNISAALGVLQHCRNLSTLVLTENFHDEEMPGDVNFQFKNLKALILPYCQLRGSIPRWLSGCNKLQLLDLSWNLLGGNIPFWFGNFEFLFYLDLSNNSFTGQIPRSLTELQSLIDRNISLVEPSLGFPLFVYRNQDARGLKYKQIWSLPPSLDLSNNMLTGPIWPDFGNLKGLHVLDLKDNYLSGTIPDSLSRMTSLETLDLSHNKLSGEIPNSLVQLSFLSKFSVAYNQLYGIIPIAGQFLTFSNSSFEGNKGLCGDQFLPCWLEQPRPPPPPPPTQSPSDRMTIIGPTFGIGATTGFILTVTFCFMSGWVFPKAEKRKKRRSNNRR